MLPLSVRRIVAAAAPQSPAAVRAAAPRAAVAFGLPYMAGSLHQHRYSSSKPSSPDDGSRDFTARPSVPASRGSKSSGEKSKAQAQAKAPMPQPPSVPSTRHIGDEGLSAALHGRCFSFWPDMSVLTHQPTRVSGLALSTFFALHRPISVTQLLPKTVSDDTFAKIFTPQNRGNKVAEVLSTLSQTVHDLEEPVSRLSGANADKQRSHGVHEAEDGSTKLNLKHADGTETSVYIQLNSLSSQCLPYHPPPPPEPLSEAEPEAPAEAETQAEASSSTTAGEAVAEQEPRTRVFKAMVTIEETVDANGQYKVVAHSPELVEEDAQPRSFLERMALRQLRYDEARRQQDRAMQALSVRRRRKLKMKKKKYKKLMRRTRNERRKQDRL